MIRERSELMPYLSEDKIIVLKEKADDIRETADELVEAGFPKVPGYSSSAEIVSAFYFHILNHDPKKPDWPDRDRLVVSDVGLLPIHCAGLLRAGYIKKNEIEDPSDLNLPVAGMETVPDNSGSGLAQAIGIALAGRLQDKKHRVYCLASDEELGRGGHWEAALFAGKESHDLNRLTLIVIRDNIQVGGMTEEVMPLEPLVEKYQDFGWHVTEVDGHNVGAVTDAVNEAEIIYEAPSVVIAHTTPEVGI